MLSILSPHTPLQSEVQELARVSESDSSALHLMENFNTELENNFKSCLLLKNR